MIGDPIDVPFDPPDADIVYPGTVDTRLSQPFQSGVDPAKLFTPERSAGALLGVLDRLTPADSGRLWAWDGQPITF